MNQRQSIKTLLEAYKNEKRPTQACKFIFENTKSFDVYNPTAPFIYNDQILIVARVEKRDSQHSRSVFFEKVGAETFKVCEGIKRYELQDPFITQIGDTWVFGGVEIFPHPDNLDSLWWRTVFYHGKDLKNLKLLCYGPNGMKDIRLVELVDDKVGVFTRPQGVIGGRGKIGYTRLDHLSDLSAKVINNAIVLEQFEDLEWGGVNQAVQFKNGNIGVLGHIANFDADGSRHYYAMAFTLDPADLSHSPMKIIATRSDMIPGPCKRDDLKDVIFSGGMVLTKDKATLYVGVSDVETQSIEIDNPFV